MIVINILKLYFCINNTIALDKSRFGNYCTIWVVLACHLCGKVKKSNIEPIVITFRTSVLAGKQLI